MAPFGAPVMTDGVSRTFDATRYKTQRGPTYFRRPTGSLARWPGLVRDIGRGHSVVGGLVLGSVAQKLVRSSPISVLVVRNRTVDDDQLAGLQQNGG
ncbi:MAG: hypothetical protein QOF28_355 [Actinomycetota bacterium]|nr:hypothetical protein [Actinomycetota bacterium]